MSEDGGNKATIDVMTWGTKSEQTSALRDNVKSTLIGGNVGHTALLIRSEFTEALYEKAKEAKVPFKIIIDENKMNKDGKIIKRTMIEVYWSFWPAGSKGFTLSNSLEMDAIQEREGVHFGYNEHFDWSAEQRKISGAIGSQQITLGPLLVDHTQMRIGPLSKTTIEDAKIKIKELESLLQNYQECMNQNKQISLSNEQEKIIEQLSRENFPDLFKPGSDSYEEREKTVLSYQQIQSMLTRSYSEYLSYIIAKQKQENIQEQNRIAQLKFIHNRLVEKKRNNTSYKTLDQTEINAINNLRDIFLNPHTSYTVHDIITKARDEYVKLQEKMDSKKYDQALYVEKLEILTREQRNEFLKKMDEKERNPENHAIILSNLQSLLNSISEPTNKMDKNSIIESLKTIDPNWRQWGIGYFEKSPTGLDSIINHIQFQIDHMQRLNNLTEYDKILIRIHNRKSEINSELATLLNNDNFKNFSKSHPEAGIAGYTFDLRDKLENLEAHLYAYQEMSQIIVEYSDSTSETIDGDHNILSPNDYTKMKDLLLDLYRNETNYYTKNGERIVFNEEKRESLIFLRKNIRSFLKANYVEHELIKNEIEKLSSQIKSIRAIDEELKNIESISILREGMQTQSDQHVTLGTPPSNIVSLNGFNMNDMLDEMISITHSEETNFDLLSQNCSSTAAQILSAGNPNPERTLLRTATAGIMNPQQVHNNALKYTENASYSPKSTTPNSPNRSENLSPAQAADKNSIRYVEIQGINPIEAIQLMKESLEKPDSVEIYIFSKETQKIVDDYMKKLDDTEKTRIRIEIFDKVLQKANQIINKNKRNTDAERILPDSPTTPDLQRKSIHKDNHILSEKSKTFLPLQASRAENAVEDKRKDQINDDTTRKSRVGPNKSI